MKFFRKKIKTSIKDKLFVQVFWPGNFSPFQKNNDILRELIEAIDQTQGSRRESVFNQLPYMTIKNMESLFQAIRDELIEDVGPVSIDKIQLIGRDENNNPSIEGLPFVENLVIDDNYQTMLKPLIRAIFTNPVFDQDPYQADFDGKRQFLLDHVFPVYREEVGLAAEDLPEIPSPVDVDRAKQTGIDLLVETAAEARANRDQLMEEATQEAVPPTTDPTTDPVAGNAITEAQGAAPATEDSASPMTNPVSATPSEQPTPQYDPTSATLTLPTTEAPAVTNPDLDWLDSINRAQDQADAQAGAPYQTPSVSVTAAPLTDSGIDISFPRFVLKEFAKQTYAPYEEEYPEWKLNEKKRQWNTFIEQREQAHRRIANQSVLQQLTVFERTEREALNHKLRHANHLGELKAAVLVEITQQRSAEASQLKADLDKWQEDSLAAAKQEYEAKVKSIKDEYQRTQQQNDADLTTKYTQLAEQELNQRFYTEKGNLEKLVDEGLADIAQAKLERQEALNQEKAILAEQAGRDLFIGLEGKIKGLVRKFQQEHARARQEYNLQRQEALHTDLAEQAQHQAQQLQANLAQSDAERQRLEEEVHATKARLLDEKAQALEKNVALAKDLLQRQTAQVPAEMPVAEKAVESSQGKHTWVKVTAAALLGLGLGGGAVGGFSYFHQQQAQHQAQIEQIQADLAAQKDQNTKLQKQRDAAQAAAKNAKAKNDDVSKKVDTLSDKLDQLSPNGSSTTTQMNTTK